MEPIVMEIRRVKGRKRLFDLLYGDRVIGSLDYPHRFRKQATLRIGEKSWTLSRPGVFKHRLLIAADQSPYSKWDIDLGWSGTTQLRTDDNQAFLFKRKGWISCKWHWFNERMENLMEIRSKQFSIQKNGVVTLYQLPDEKILWLILAGWFVVMCYEDDSTAVAIMS